MRSILLSSALTFALSALPAMPALLAAQTPDAASNASESSRPVLSAALLRGAAFSSLPDAPSAIHLPVTAEPAALISPPCNVGTPTSSHSGMPCFPAPNPYRRFLDTNLPTPLTPRQKGLLAIHNVKDPFNLITITGTAAFTVGTNSHTAYGPGWAGFGRNTGYSFLQDATGEFFGTFLIPSLSHQDPHYHRLPNAGVPRRAWHAISATVVAQHDDGTPMLNYANLLTNPICAEISNLYVPGIAGDAPSTAKRIMTGYAFAPADTLITEFLPDLAKRIHVRVILVQRILNRVSNDSTSAGE